jgi:GNAT superfamily N-acetyltransferase
MQIREMFLTELEAVMDLHLEGLEQELALMNLIFPGKSVDYSGRDQLNRLLTQVVTTGEGQIIVAIDQGKYAGYCLVTKKVYPVEKPKLCGCINGIYVKEPYKRQGVGTKLFQDAVSWLKREGVTYLELYHMINDERATSFWQKMGFKPVQLNCAMKLT